MRPIILSPILMSKYTCTQINIKLLKQSGIFEMENRKEKKNLKMGIKVIKERDSKKYEKKEKIDRDF